MEKTDHALRTLFAVCAVLVMGLIVFQSGLLLAAAVVLLAVTVLRRKTIPHFTVVLLLAGVLALLVVWSAAGLLAGSLVKATGLNEHGLQNGAPLWKLVVGLNYDSRGTFSSADWARRSDAG